ncbi:hypothetical protein ACHAXR_006412 [Thalassiosira sp. AJA248-18]
MKDISMPDMKDISMPDMKDKIVASLSNKQPTPPTGGGLRPSPPLTPSPPPPFDPTNPEALISITKSFIATDFGIQSSQLPDYSTAPKRTGSSDASSAAAASATASALPFYSSSLLSSNSFVWVSGNNINDGRTGLLTKEEYLAAGRYFDLRKSFPDLEYRAHDFRVIYDEAQEYDSNTKNQLQLGSGSAEDSATATPIERLGRGGEISVRFTTMTTGTFRGAPLRLRSMTLEPNGKVMKCPPTSTQQGEDRGKITKLVTDMVLDRQVGNTNGLSGIPAAAVIGGAPESDSSVPPLVALGRFFGRPIKPIDSDKGMMEGNNNLAPFPDSVMIQLAKGVLASNLGLNDPNLLAENFVYVEPLMGPLDKEKYLEQFSGDYDVLGGVPDLDYGLQNFRVDPYDPYRVWVDSRPTGTRIGSIGKRALPKNVNYAIYKAPPEGISFTFDDDGFCTRHTAAAVMDPLLGNTGGLGGVYGLLYATGTPVSSLKTRSLNGILSRASKSLFKGVGADGWKLSDGRVVNALLPPTNGAGIISLPSMPSSPTKKIAAAPPKLPPQTSSAAAAPPKPFFAVEAPVTKQQDQQQQQRPTISLPKVAVKPPVKPPPPPPRPAVTRQIPTTKKKPTPPIIVDTNPADPVTEALNSAFGISTPAPKDNSGSSGGNRGGTATTTTSTTSNKAQQLRNAAAAARAEAAEAKQKAADKKANELAEKQAAMKAKLEKQAAIDAEKEKQRQAADKLRMEKQQKQQQVLAEKQKQKQAADQLRMEKQQKQQLLAQEAVQKRKEQQEMMAQQKKNGLKQQQTKSRSTTSTASKGAAGSSGGMFSFFTSSRSSSAQPQPKKTPSSKKVVPPKKSKSSLPSQVKPPNRSPTISLFGSSKKSASAPPTKKQTAATAKNQQPKKKQVKPSPVVANKGRTRSPTISLFGTSKKSSPKQPSTGKKAAAAAVPTAPRKKSPTFNIFGIGGGGATAATTKKQSSSPATADSSPKKKPSTKQSSSSTVVKRSPTISLFNQSSFQKKEKPSASAKKTASEKKTASAPAKKSPTFNLFGGSSIGRNNNSKKATSTTAVTKTNKKKLIAPRGVPTLKQWKQVKDNAIEGRIYGSNSFKDGVTVTTSSINSKKIAKGTVVQTKSGSKYFLDE